MLTKHLCSSIVLLMVVGCAAAPQQQGVLAPGSTSDGMVLVPAGEFTMGSNKEENVSMWRDANALNPFGFNEQLYINERPSHKVTLPSFKIDKYEVSNAQYRDFVVATQHSVPTIWPFNGYIFSDSLLQTFSLDELRQVATNNFRLDMDVTSMSKDALLVELQKINALRDNYPVTYVTWSDAYDYCNWAGKRLPTEAEWEKTARGGSQGFEYPWGNSWDPKKVNTMSNDQDVPYSAVGSYPDDKSAYGAYDMAANVAEWVADWYDAYPDAPPLPAEIKSNYGRVHRVIRGGMASSGHYDSISVVFRAARRMHLAPYSALIDLGFRCAKDVTIDSAR